VDVFHDNMNELIRSNFSSTPNQKNIVKNMLLDSLWCTDNEYMHEGHCWWVFTKSWYTL